MGQRTTEDVRLDLEYFERIEVNPRLILLRVGGHPAPEDDVALLVTAEGDQHRTAPLAGSVAVEPDGRWRAAFPIRRELIDADGVSFALEAGERIDLPSPTSRVLTDTDEDAVGTNGTAPAAAEEEQAEAQPADAQPADAEAVPEPVDEGAAPPPPAPARTRRGGAGLVAGTIVLGIVAAAAVILFAVNQGGGGSSATSSTPPPAASTPSTSTPAPTPARGKPQQLAALPGSGVHATARATPLGGRKVALTIHGLPRGTYQAWAFDSIIDATSLATFHGPDARVTVTLPPNAGHYHFLDVSREGDASPNHSGRSVLRVPMSSLTG